jgi:hypothetical protein
LLHIGRQLRAQRHPALLMHPMELLDLSYRGQRPVLPQGAAR